PSQGFFVWVEPGFGGLVKRRAALASRPPYCQFDYWPSCSLIASWIFCFTASRLNVAGACIGGELIAVSASFATYCCTRTRRQNSRAKKSFVYAGALLFQLSPRRFGVRSNGS